MEVPQKISILLLTLFVASAATSRIEVSPGPNTYTISDSVVGRTRVWKILDQSEDSFHPRNVLKKRAVPATEFAVGELTRTSKMDIGIAFNFSAYEHELLSIEFTDVTRENTTFTFIETFDVSPNGRSGGTVELLDGGIGQQHFRLKMRALRIGAPIQIHIVAYAEDKFNGGQNFMMGRYGPNMSLWHYEYVQLNGTANEVVSYDVVYDWAPSKLVYIAGTDWVHRGSGGLVAYAGGIGQTNATLKLQSGIGENLEFSVMFYGIRIPNAQ